MKQRHLAEALGRLGPEDWSRFEKFASSFLVPSFPNLRTVAGVSGDRGRDAELYTAESLPNVLIQYSVAKDFRTKIRGTLKRISETFNSAKVLIYVTNQKVAAGADDLKNIAIRDYGLSLDVRDQSWFCERFLNDDITQREAFALFDEYCGQPSVRLPSYSREIPQLTNDEQKSAFIYLSMQLEDDSKDKGLTRLCFEALVKSALRGTHSASRMARSDILERVRAVLPTHPKEEVDRRTNSALLKLAKKVIKHHTKEDEFCLSHEESIKEKKEIAELEADHNDFVDELTAKVEDIVNIELGDQDQGIHITKGLLDRLIRLLRSLLFSRGSNFVSAVQGGELKKIGLEGLNDLIINDFSAHPAKTPLCDDEIGLCQTVIRDILLEPSEVAGRYLHRLANTYTLLAFLRETPDVQSATVKLFSRGEIWLDTTVILPIFVEEFLESEKRRLTNMIKSSRDSGLKIYVTRGVINEVVSHMRRCTAYGRTRDELWIGSVPFLYSSYLQAGNRASSFNSWLENFRGDERPETDVADYLNEFYGIEVRDLPESENASQVLRGAVQEVWYDLRSVKMERLGRPIDPTKLRKLVMHDVECYVGIIERRRQDSASNLEYGYTAWWLTFDKTAYEMRQHLKSRIEISQVPSSPVISADFLSDYLVFGPMRSKVNKDVSRILPIIAELEQFESIPAELASAAEAARENAEGLAPHVIRRRIRDDLDRAKRKSGKIMSQGLDYIEIELEVNDEDFTGDSD